jgi:hypothetical protein
MRYRNSDTDADGDRYSDGKRNTNGNRYGNGYSDGKRNADRYRNGYGYGEPDGNRNGNAAVYPDAQAASDASAASERNADRHRNGDGYSKRYGEPDGNSNGNAAVSITVTETIKAGTRERNSRVPRFQMDWLLRTSTLEKNPKGGTCQAPKRRLATVGKTQPPKVRPEQTPAEKV